MTEVNRDPNAADVAVIGLGVMGRAIAGRLMETGQSVRGYDIAAAATDQFAASGGISSQSPADAARDVSRALVVVHDERQVDAVTFAAGGLVESFSEGGIVWLASTVSPAYVRSLADRLTSYGIRLVDAPVSGGPGRAVLGELSIFIGGDESAVALLRPLMQRCATKLFPAGPVGGGSSMKLINQILTATNIALTAEALALGERAGVDASLLIAAITQSAGTSRQFEVRAPRMATGDYRVDATVRTFLKDLSIAVDAARDLGAVVPIANAARAVFATAGDLGMLDGSDTMLLRAYEQNLEPERSPTEDG